MVAYAFSWLSLVITFILAATLEMLSLPDMLNSFRPEWLVLTLVYWLLRYPERVGMAAAVVAGLVMDVMAGSYFGIHMLAMSVISYLVLAMQQRLKMFPVVQQSIVVFFIVGIELMVVYSLRSALSVVDSGLDYLWQALASAMFWPVILVLYDRLVFALR